MKNDIKRVRDLVLICMSEDERACNDDNRLYFLVCEKMGLNTEISVKEMLLSKNGFPKFESVRRSRQFIQQHGLCKANESVAQWRRDEEKEMHSLFGRSFEA